MVLIIGSSDENGVLNAMNAAPKLYSTGAFTMKQRVSGKDLTDSAIGPDAK